MIGFEGGGAMTLARLIRMVGVTVAIGVLLGLATTLTGLFGQVSLFKGASVGGFISATSCMGLWAYLTLNFVMRSISFRIWVAMQVLITGVVLWDLSYFRYMFVVQGQGSIWPYVGYALWPFAIAIIGSWLKARRVGLKAFLPALFYLYAFTAIEWIPGLHTSDAKITTQMGIILLGCNLYLLLTLGKAIKTPSVQ